MKIRPTKFTRVLVQSTLAVAIGLAGLWILVSMLDAEAVL